MMAMLETDMTWGWDKCAEYKEWATKLWRKIIDMKARLQ